MNFTWDPPQPRVFASWLTLSTDAEPRNEAPARPDWDDAAATTGERLLPFKVRGVRRFALAWGAGRRALAAEIAGRWETADFWWDESRRLINGMRSACWDAVAGEVSRERKLSGDECCRAWHLEVMAEVFAGLLNRWMTLHQLERADGRLRVTATRLTDALRAGGAGAADTARMHGCIADNLEGVDAAAAALRELERAIALTPDDMGLKESWVRLQVKIATGRLASDRTATSTELRQLADSIASLAGRLREWPDCDDAVEALALLHRLHAVELANRQRPSDALVAIENTVQLSPGWERAQEDRVKIEEMMTNMQASMEQLEQQLRQQPGASLNEQGLRMREQARAGFGPRDRFRKSSEATALQEAGVSARAAGLWRAAKLGPLKPEQIGLARDFREALIKAADIATASRAMDANELAGAWLQICEQQPRMKDLDAQKVLRFMHQRLLDEPAEDEPTASPEPATAQAPQVDAAVVRAKPDHPPVFAWLLSPSELGVKLVAAAALVVLGWAAWSWSAAYHLRWQRDAAFAALSAAITAHDHPGAIEAAGKFLAVRLPVEDLREKQVREACRGAALAWARDATAISPEDAQRIQSSSALWPSTTTAPRRQ